MKNEPQFLNIVYSLDMGPAFGRTSVSDVLILILVLVLFLLIILLLGSLCLY